MMRRKANGAAIAALREALGMQQGALAANAGIKGPFLSQIENGLRQPSPQVIHKLAIELGVSLEAITYPVYAETAAS